MLLCGLQKLTLLDYPGKMAATVFTGGCNFRCPFCHNAGLVISPGQEGSVSEPDFFAFLQKRRNLLDGVCVTGGEPLLQPDLPAFLQKIKELGFLVKLDTNGSSPAALRSLVQAGLVDAVAMDLKSSPAGYGAAIGLTDFSLADIEQSVAFLLSDKIEYEFRTTCVKGLHTAADFRAIANWIAGAKAYYLQGFVDSGHLICQNDGLQAFSKREMEDFLALVRPAVPSAQLRGID